MRPPTSIISTRARATTRSATRCSTRRTARCTGSPRGNEKPAAGLADGDPQISDDKKEITVKIKTGIKYAPPVDREVKSEDVKYAIERAFSANVPSGYATSYFGDIVGAPDAPSKGVKPTGRRGAGRQTLIIKLDRPVPSPWPRRS